MSTVIVQNSKGADIRTALQAVPGLDENGDMELIKAPFTATGTTDLAGLTQATFPGYAVKTSAAAPELVFDPITGKWLFVWPDPEDGWIWTRASGAGDPETIYGVRVVGFGCFLIPPVLITNEGDSVIIGDIRVPVTDLPFNS